MISCQPTLLGKAAKVITKDNVNRKEKKIDARRFENRRPIDIAEKVSEQRERPVCEVAKTFPKSQCFWFPFSALKRWASSRKASIETSVGVDCDSVAQLSWICYFLDTWAQMVSIL